jgi:ABC-type nickel/cobalt efflux system permease component RcnA
MLNKRDVRVLSEGLLVTFVGALVLYLLRHHVVLALLCGIAACLIVIVITVILEKRDVDKAAAKVERRKLSYRLLISVGNEYLKKLDRSLQQESQASQKTDLGEEEAQQLDQAVIHEANVCYGWMSDVLTELEDVIDRNERTALISHGLKRQKPNYVGTDRASEIWIQTASRLDWLIDELSKL